MNYHPLLTLTIAAFLCPAAMGQSPADKPFTESDLLKQIEALSPTRPAAAKNDRPPASLFDSGFGDPLKLGVDKRDKPSDKAADPKTKGPTVITALQATFDQKANVAVFIGDVVVKDPEFNCFCDKLTAHLKHNDKGKVAPGAAGAPATPKPGTSASKSDDAKPGGSGLEKAVAEMTSDRRVIITQDKTEADGSITRSIGKSDWATYDANTGDIVLYGSPDVIQSTTHVVATDPKTVMTLNRAGQMKADGPHKTTIVVDKGDSR